MKQVEVVNLCGEKWWCVNTTLKYTKVSIKNKSYFQMLLKKNKQFYNTTNQNIEKVITS